MSTPPRKKKRFLAPQEKYEIWMQLVKGETTIGEAADRSGVDRSTISKLRDVARQGALDALARSRPGKRERDFELAEARAEAEASVVITDVVSRKWISDVTSTEETSIQVQTAFT